MRVPSSTYRLQFHNGFTLADAASLIGYLEELGITDLYSSPILKARAGSTHGYDVTDPTQINPEIGTMAQLRALGETLQSRDMGLLLDIVPNHMAASTDNPWWWDLLRHGEKSRYASFFDIDWTQKLLVPLLDRPYGEALEAGELEVRVEAGEAAFHYHGARLPISLPAEADLSNPNGLDRVLSHQPYRLAYWRKAGDAINYRRFFDIADLVGLRSEREEVFRAAHEFVLKLLSAGLVTGFRIDHIDGLRDPQCYLERLPPVYVVVEKILAGREALTPQWRVWGTTGYDFLNVVNGLFIDREGYETLKRIYAGFAGCKATIQEVLRARKRQVMKILFAGEVRALTRTLAKLAEEDRHGRDLPLDDLEEALVHATACLPVYRTYVRQGEEISDQDRYQIEDAIAVANRLNPSPAYAFLRRVLLVEPPCYLEHRRSDWLDFVMRWQQLTGPVMAKGFEDTTCYVFNPLLSANEVGGDPNGPESSFGVQEFHRRMQERRSRWPFTMNAGSTHDTKRSEDVRARINVLSELPEEFERYAKRWRRRNQAGAAPDENEQILIYQTMLGAWPMDSGRLKQYVTKALREAKTHSSWTVIDEDYEQAVLGFVDRILDPAKSAAFLEDFKQFQSKIAFYGAVSSLAQLILRMTAPGVPDFYQGTEIWDYSLADPDNRCLVDFASRERMLEELKAGADWSDLLKNWQDGRVKMYSIVKTLQFRRRHPELFLHGDYLPLRARGRRAENVVAFARRYQREWAVTVVPRLVAGLTRPGRWPIDAAVWRDTAIEFAEASPAEWVNILTGERLPFPLIIAKVFGTVPLAVLHGVL